MDSLPEATRGGDALFTIRIRRLQVQGKLVCEWFDHPLCRYEHIWYQTITSFCPCGEKWATNVFCEWD